MADGNKPEPSPGKGLTAALKAVVRPHPDPAAWQKAQELARHEYGRKADLVLAAGLARRLARRRERKQPVSVGALAGFLAGTVSPDLIRALAGAPETLGRQLALALLGRWPSALDKASVRSLRRLLRDRGLPAPPKLAALALLVRGNGTDSAVLSRCLRALTHGHRKLRSLVYLKRLERLAGPSPAIEALRARLEEGMMLSCPRCQVELQRTEMIQHLWEQHRLVLDDRTVRDPWSLVEDWIAAYRESNDPELLERCRTLAGRLEAGDQKLRQLLLTRQVADAEVLTELVAEARRRHASVCPWCFGLIPQPVAAPPLEVVQVEGCLGAAGYLVLVSDGGWRTSLEVRTPRRLIHQGPEPNRRWTWSGAAALVAVPLMLATLAIALRWPGRGWPHLFALLLLAYALVWMLVAGWLWRAPFSIAERARRYAWRLLVPELPREGFLIEDSAFLAGLARRGLKDGLGDLRAPLLPPLVEHLEKAVVEGTVPAVHLAAVRRLLVADAVAEGADPIPLVVEQIALCFEGKLPLLYAEQLLDGWESSWWTRGNLNRLRVLLCDRAFEAGYEVRNLLDAGQTVPSLGTVLRTERPNELATLRLFWSLRAGQPWDRCGPMRTAFELARDPEETELFSLYPDLLLWQEEPDWPKVAEVNQEAPTPVRILLCARGVFCQQTLFSMLPRRVEMVTRWRRCELRLDDKIFWSVKMLDELEHRLERWFRYAFLDFLPQVPRVQLWQAPDRTTLFRAWGARPCPECQKYFLPRPGEVGVAQVEDAPVAQVID